MDNTGIAHVAGPVAKREVTLAETIISCAIRTDRLRFPLVGHAFPSPSRMPKNPIFLRVVCVVSLVSLVYPG